MADVENKRTDFFALLVYDVSRWGRFQDIDESTYCEYVLTLGGYQVLKKWLSYREFTEEPTSPLLHRALHPEEAAYFAQVVRRIAGILLLGPALDASYRAILPTATGLPTALTRAPK